MSDEYKIPQQIEIEDKILGPFTLRQFLYMIVGGVTVYILFLIVGQINIVLFFTIAFPIALLTLGLVFIKINERPFAMFLGYFLAFMIEPRIRIWEKSTRVKKIMVQSKTESEQSKREVARRTKKGLVRSRLEELAMIVDTKGWGGEEEELGMKERVASSVEVMSVTKTTLKEDEPLEDVFADLEEAMENITAEADKRSEGEFDDLAANLSGLISKK